MSSGGIDWRDFSWSHRPVLGGLPITLPSRKKTPDIPDFRGPMVKGREIVLGLLKAHSKVTGEKTSQLDGDAFAMALTALLDEMLRERREILREWGRSHATNVEMAHRIRSLLGVIRRYKREMGELYRLTKNVVLPGVRRRRLPLAIMELNALVEQHLLIQGIQQAENATLQARIASMETEIDRLSERLGYPKMREK